MSLLANDGLNEEDLYNRLRAIVIDHHSPLHNKKTYSGGKTTRMVLAPATYAESLQLSSEGAYPSNGSLMRAAPMALYFVAKDQQYDRANMDIVRRMSAVTHRHLLAKECCLVYVDVLTDLLLGSNLREAMSTYDSWRDRSTRELSSVLWNISSPPLELWPHTGAALTSLHVALWALVTTSSFREGITKVVSLGGDTDTYGAIAGGLLGAYYGESGIPDDWKNILIGRQVMERLADEFSIMANENM